MSVSSVVSTTAILIPYEEAIAAAGVKARAPPLPVGRSAAIL